MNIYDDAHALARKIRESDEYKQYHAAIELANENETNKALLQEYKRMQFKLQMQMAAGEKADEADMDRFQKLTGLLQMSSEAMNALMSEMRLQKMLADIYKILGDAAGIDFGFMQG